MKIEVLGTGCPQCAKLAALAQQAVNELKLDCELEKVTDIADIISRGIMLTPALTIDGRLAFSGRVPPLDELKAALRKE